MLVNYDNNKNGFGKRLKSQRTLFNLSQEKLAEEIGCSTQYIYFIESGKRKPSIEALLSLSAYFGVSIDYLLKGNQTESNDILESVIKELTPLQRESLANTIMLMRFEK